MFCDLHTYSLFRNVVFNVVDVMRLSQMYFFTIALTLFCAVLLFDFI